MKNASKHAEELKSLVKKLVKDRPERPEMDPLVAIVRGLWGQRDDRYSELRGLVPAGPRPEMSYLGG